jgi:phenylacetic acid degradation operon negative regulatory protein
MKSRFLTNWIADFLAGRSVRANSLIITIYGDAIAPHGGTVWLGSFIKLVEPLGLNHRVVRTSVFRLARERWLVSEQIGRRSFYSLTATGKRRFEHAYRRIYDVPQGRWEGDWQIVLIGSSALTPAQRESLRKELCWEGFGPIAPGVLAHPSEDLDSLRDILEGTATHDKVVVLRARSVGALSGRPLQDLVRECWGLDALAGDYESFLDHFRPALRAVRSADRLDPEQCFVLRTLLIHEYRRVLLRDPQLPDQLLPGNWPGITARQLCRELYLATQAEAERHLMNVLETANGPLPPAAAYFCERFGGLGEAKAAARSVSQ